MPSVIDKRDFADDTVQGLKLSTYPPSDIASGGLQSCTVEICHAGMTRSTQQECRGILEQGVFIFLYHVIKKSI